MFELKIVTGFAAAHQLKMVAKKCENLHGHNWKVEVCISGDRLNSAGVLMDFGVLKSYTRTIMDRLDHKFLNDINELDSNPSSENIAVYIANELKPMISDPGIRIKSVTTWESDDACATYFPEY